jgi:hypothetical protein
MAGPLQEYNPYGFDGAPFEVRDLLPNKVQEAYDNSFEFIGKYDTDRDWEDFLNLRPIHKRLRIRIWQELARMAQYNSKKFVITRVLQHETDPRNFYRMIKNPEVCAYFFTKPIDHQLESRVLLDDSIENIRKILRLDPIHPKTGAVVGSVITAQLKAHKMLEDRVLGQTVQRIQQHTVQENVRPDTKPLPDSIEDLEKELKVIESSSPLKTLSSGEPLEKSEDSQKEE